MNTRIRCSYFALALVFSFTAGVPGYAREAVASSPPRDLNHLATAGSIADAAQRDIRQYAAYWTAELASGEPRAMREASRKLREPLGVLGVTLVFRYEYARAAIPHLDQILNETDNHQVAVNAVQAARDIGMEPGLQLMVQRSDVERESRVGVRVWAARGFQSIVTSDLGETAGQRALARSVREFARAAQQETEWLVLYRQFEALAAAPDSLQQQVELLSTVLGKMQQNESANPKMQAVHRAVVLLRDQYMDRDPTGQREMGELVGRGLGKVLQTAEMHWDFGHEDAEVSAWYLGAVQAAETLLKRIDASVRTATVPNTNLDVAWERGDRAAFQAQVEQWDRILRQQPYRN